MRTRTRQDITDGLVEGAHARRTFDAAAALAGVPAEAACAVVAATTEVPARVNAAAVAKSTLRAA